ncbi:hypothetical protein [Halovivax gelatinilyticus]|uniref:hypothetical protein n=1 Tax=Halovivax gelatinilyticus TaxID=2961597 RepID=UPI0020CA7D32|nr:hypothetical protein [Halovivax gelatinilyticus]
MSEEVPVTEIFEDVEPDPDAIIASYGAESVEDLIDGPGEHDPVAYPEFDGDVDEAATRLRDLADVQLEPAGGETANEGEAGGESTTVDRSGPRYSADSVGGGATVDVLPGDGETLAEFLGITDLDDAESTEENGFVLAGPKPSATRVSNDSFGPADAPAVSNCPGESRTRVRPRSNERPDPFAVDSDAATKREAELASTVFEWVS